MSKSIVNSAIGILVAGLFQPAFLQTLGSPVKRVSDPEFVKLAEKDKELKAEDARARYARNIWDRFLDIRTAELEEKIAQLEAANSRAEHSKKLNAMNEDYVKMLAETPGRVSDAIKARSPLAQGKVGKDMITRFSDFKTKFDAAMDAVNNDFWEEKLRTALAKDIERIRSDIQYAKNIMNALDSMIADVDREWTRVNTDYWNQRLVRALESQAMPPSPAPKAPSTTPVQPKPSQPAPQRAEVKEPREPRSSDRMPEFKGVGPKDPHFAEPREPRAPEPKETHKAEPREPRAPEPKEPKKAEPREKGPALRGPS